VAVLSILVLLTVMGGMLIHIVMKETRLGALRRLGAQSLYLAEAGGYAARAGLMALVSEDPQGQAVLDPATVTAAQLTNWYAGGAAAAQNPLALFDNFVLEGLRYTFNPTSATPSIVFEVNWALAQALRKLQAAPGNPAPACPVNPPAAVGNPPANPLGRGVYSATLVVCKRLAAHPTDPGDPTLRYVQLLGANTYQFFYSYVIISNGQVAPQSRRRVLLSGDFSVRVVPDTFAKYALFTHVHALPGGGGGGPAGSAIWFTNRTSFDGPVHTNGEFRFAFFPKFSDRVTSAGCLNAACTNADRDFAWFNNLGSDRRLQANENVVGGVRRDAPVQFDNTPGNINDDNDNAPAVFTRGVDPITLPPNSYNQRAISIGHDPVDTAGPNGWTSAQWNGAIRQVIPELADDTSTVPNAIYVPVADANGNGSSDAGEALAGGIYVQGDLTSLTLSTSGPTGNLARYTFVQGSQTVTVTVDRAAQTTTVNNTCWNPPTCSQSGSRTFAGVPKGWQGGPGQNGTMIYVQGTVGNSSGSSGLSGTLEEKEQATLASSGRINITGHLRYEDPPDPADPFDNPLNVLGLFSASNDIRITTAAPDDVVVHAVLMAGQPGVSDGYNSSVYVQNYDSGAPRGSVHLIGGVIEEYYGAFGQFDSSTGNPTHGYGRDFTWDRRVGRGIVPPYFPTTGRFRFDNAVPTLAGHRPVWREAAP
jgi:hypothetical protein